MAQPQNHIRASVISYTIAGAAEAVGLTHDQIRNAIRAGHLKAFKLRNRRLILREDLETYVKAEAEAVDPEKLTVKEAAEAVGVSIWTIYNAIHTGELSAETFGGQQVIDRANLYAYVNLAAAAS